MLKSALGVLAFLLFGTVPFLAQSHNDEPSPAALELLSVGPENLAGSFPGVLGFDISPDGQTLCLEVISASDQSKQAISDQNEQVIQIEEWDVPSRKRKATKLIEGPAKLLLSNRQFRYDLRFTPDGQYLVALAVARVFILNAQTLTPLREIGLPLEPASSSEFGWVLDSFGISGDGSKLGVVSRGVGPTCGDYSNFRLFDSESGALLSSWHFHGCSSGLSLSTNGTRALVGLRANQVEPWKGELVDTASGEILRTFPGGSGDFLDDLRFISSIGYPDNPKPSDLKRAALGIINVNTQKVEHEMRYGKYGMVGQFAVAPSAGLVAVMETWQNPKDLARDLTYTRGFVRLILFRISDTEPFYVSPNIHDSPMFRSDYIARLSRDGRVVAYGGSTIHVVKIVRSSGGSSTEGSAEVTR